MVQESTGHSVEHVDEPLSPLGTGRTEIDLEEPGLQFLVEHEVEPIDLEAVGSMLDASLLAGSDRLDDNLLDAFSYLLALLSIVLEGLLEELLLAHHQVLGLVCHLGVVLLDREVREVLVGILDVAELIFRAADPEVELGEDIDLQGIEAGDQHPLADVEFPDLVEMIEQKGLLDVLLDNLGLGLRVPQEGLELLQAVVDAVYTEATGVVARLYDPDVSGAISDVLRYCALHGLVALDEPTNRLHRRPLPPLVAVRIDLPFNFVFRAGLARQNRLEHFQLLLVRWLQLRRDLLHAGDWELQLGVRQ